MKRGALKPITNTVHDRVVTRLSKKLDKIELGKRKQPPTPSPTPSIHQGDETDSDVEVKTRASRKKIKVLAKENDLIGFEEYQNEILTHLIKTQGKISDNYFQVQTELKLEARICMIDWIHGIHKHFKLHTETYFQTISLIDRFLTLKPISVNSAQLCALSCLILACKYEEVLSPSLDHFVQIASSPYVTRELLLKAEVYVLKTLEFVMGLPSSYSFFNIFIINNIKCKVSDKMICFAKLVLETFTLVLELIHFDNMQLALAAYSITFKAFHLAHNWEKLEAYTDFSKIKQIEDLFFNHCNQKEFKGSSVFDKFLSKKNWFVSKHLTTFINK